MAMVPAVFSLLLLSLCLHIRAQQNQSNLIKPGSSLSPVTHPSWLSPSGHFAFGFYPQGRNGFAVGIWLVGQHENVTVWTANRDDPPVSFNATLDFTREGFLLLRTEDGRETRNISQDQLAAAVSASMLDTGNFVLYNDSAVIWESFDYPTDTLLGGQNLTAYDSLISSVSSWNHSTGKFYFTIWEGDLVSFLGYSGLSVADATYWSSNTDKNDFVRLNLNNRGLLCLYGDDSQVHTVANRSYSGNNNKNTIYRATIDPDGVFRMYLHKFESGTSSIDEKMEWQNLEDRCLVKVNCGFNSYCSMRDNNTECYCYPGFTLINENNKSLGCSQNFTEDDCMHRKYQVMQYNITTMENTEWDDSPYSAIQMKQADCKKSCQEDCYCGGVLYSSTGNCKKYKLPLRFGKRSKNLSTIAFLKLINVMNVSSTHYTPLEPSRPTVIIEENPHLLSSIAIILGSISCLCFVLAISGFLMYKHRIHSYRKLSENTTPGLMEQFTLRSFSYNELDEATEGFKEELGRGSFGAVYKGTLPVGAAKIVAVKRLEKFDEGEREFQSEMTAIGRTNHRNLVRLLGYCVEGSKKLLVYEYLSNGSLADFLFHSKLRPVWKERVRIALDVAKGILYLHDECVVRIIHCNIKPRNILLDDSLTAKISDFGLAKLLMPNQTSITAFKGTGGHSAPEWQRNAPISVKVDVYSCGITLLEIICCRSSMEVNVCTADEILLSSWAYNCFDSGQLSKLVADEPVDVKMLERVVKVALWCVQDDPTLRPSMKNVILMLEGTMEVSIPPSPHHHHSLDDHV